MRHPSLPVVIRLSIIPIIAVICLAVPTRAATTLTFGSDNDTIPLGLGNYQVDGGGGSDTLVLPLFPNAYDVVESGPHEYSAQYLGYTSQFVNVEYAQFGSYFPATVPLSDLVSYKAQLRLAQLTDLYLAFFGRAPDVSGLEYWQMQLFTYGRDFVSISKDFAWSEEAQRLFPQNASNREFVQSIYQNCFNREPDPGGWDYWTAKLDGMGTTDLNDRGAFVGELILGAYAPTSGGEDRTLLINRHVVAMYYLSYVISKQA